MFRAVLNKAKDKTVAMAGGPARLQVMAILAAVLALDSADKGTVPAIGTELKRQFSIGNTQFGLLLAVVAFSTAIFTLPMGVLVDRLCRKRILLAIAALWALAMLLCAASTSYLFLLLARVFLGAVVAGAWPCVASLTGDFFPANERAAIYGRILGGELIGAGIGFFISGELSSFVNWRWAFVAMAIFSAPLFWAVWRHLPEPARGSQKTLRLGETDPEAASGAEHLQASRSGGRKSNRDEIHGPSTRVRKIAERERIGPREELILHEDPTRCSWLSAICYCLRIPTYRLLIMASGLAYYFFSGASAFAMIYFRQHYRVSHSTFSAVMIILGLGALLGVVGGGVLSQLLLRRGYGRARIILPAIALLASVPFFGFGIWITSLWLGVLLLTAGAMALSAAIAPIDAARQDIMHPRLWGRAESGRMAIRSGFEGTAPLVFGALSMWLGGGQQGLMWTFLLMLSPMIAASLFVLPARRTYLADVATAAASFEATKDAVHDGRADAHAA